MCNLFASGAQGESWLSQGAGGSFWSPVGHAGGWASNWRHSGVAGDLSRGMPDQICVFIYPFGSKVENGFEKGKAAVFESD